MKKQAQKEAKKRNRNGSKYRKRRKPEIMNLKNAV